MKHVCRSTTLEKLAKLAFAGAMLSLMAGCSIYSLPGSEPAPVEPDAQSAPSTSQPAQTPVTPTSPDVAPDPNANNAYGALLQQAEQARNKGDYERALTLLERAQRIDPDSGEVYLHLARTYQAKGDLTMQHATAERGLLYCNGSSECSALRALSR
ncbi:MAG: tetratricopeptide repeat protein [Halioglobus sp.]